MTETSLEEVISERAFAGVLSTQAEMLYRLGNTLRARTDEDWGRRHFSQLVSEADTLESLLDDYGARYNRTYSHYRELVASLRGLALAGLSIAHLERRIDSYGTILSIREADTAAQSIRKAKSFVMTSVRTLLEAMRDEGRARGLEITDETFPEGRYGPDDPRKMLPRNMGQQDLENDEQKVAEVASKFIQACGMFDDIGVKRIQHEDEREAYLQRTCSEEQARVYEATVHNLQSAYDTYVKNTVIEARDSRLPKLRGHVSAALHMLEAVTHLTHFVERHESGARNDALERRIAALVRRAEVRDITLNHLLHWAAQFMRRGRTLADDLLPSYTHVRVLEVELADDLTLHARPAALIVGIVNRYGTPVEMEVAGKKCNAASILDLMVTVGSRPDARRFIFRGDVNPLRDIQLLFQSGIGESGIDRLPPALAYLRNDA
jgi:phosphotransferase system HPr-like phosphotransfer protein